MADQRITQLNEVSKAGVTANDVLAIVSGSETKKVTAKNLVDAGLDLVDANSIDLNKLDQSSTTKIDTAAIADDAVTTPKSKTSQLPTVCWDVALRAQVMLRRLSAQGQAEHC